MANFATLQAAETRAELKVADGTWIMAHAGIASTGSLYCVRAQRKMSPTNPDNGGWVEITDDSQT